MYLIGVNKDRGTSELLRAFCTTDILHSHEALKVLEEEFLPVLKNGELKDDGEPFDWLELRDSLINESEQDVIVTANGLNYRTVVSSVAAARNKVPMIVEVTETLQRRVIISVEGKDNKALECNAYARAENLCNEGTIDLSAYDFVSRDISVIRKAIPEDCLHLEKYN